MTTASARPLSEPLDPRALAALRARYEGVDDPAVTGHLTEHPEVVPALLDAAARLREVFGPAVVLRLEAPRFAGDELFARVHGHGLDAARADERTREFWGWWHAVDPALDAARRWLEFGVGWG